MGHTFLFRGSPKGRTDSVDHWLTVLAGDAALLADCAGGRSFAQLSERLASLAADRSRKGRTKYRGTVCEAVETLLAREQALLSSRTPLMLYPSLAAHLQKKARYVLQLVRAKDAPVISGTPAMKEAAFYLRLVKETAELCMRYLDPSERTAYMQIGSVCHALDELCERSEVYGMSCGREQGCSALAAEGEAAVGAYRELLAELDGRYREGRLFGVFPPTFLVWADTTCATMHRCLKRLARGKAVPDIADEFDDDITAEYVRAEDACAEVGHLPAVAAEHTPPMIDEPIVILADSASQADEQASECGDEAETACDEIVEAGDMTAERIYAKASDYKNVIQRKREHNITKPRPLGRR